MPTDLSDVPVLVLGASGFLGRRLVERLVLERRARVRVIVRSVMGAAPLARLPIEVRVGDILDRRLVAEVADGCAVVFNCAKGKGGDAALRRAVDVEGTRNVVEAAHQVGARVVHVSTMAVYDLPREGDVTEATADAPRGDAYSETKLEGERLARELGLRSGVPVVVIQPTVVYGPNAGVHGTEILEALRTSRMILVDDGKGICNAVYVDDVVSALLLAATGDRAPGERFLISGPDHPTWREFFSAFERMLGVSNTTSLSESEASALWRQSQKRPWLLPEAFREARTDRALRDRLLATREGAIARELVLHARRQSLGASRRKAAILDGSARSEAEPALAPLRPWLIRYLAKRAFVRTDKARDLLGYEPVFQLDDGMRLTEQWARWAGLLP